jgi:hypothetical protein
MTKGGGGEDGTIKVDGRIGTEGWGVVVDVAIDDVAMDVGMDVVVLDATEDKRCNACS